ncbi:acetoacetate decarboxylase family protein [Inquilinus sp. CAU 1745]|uniref:acetoacetate decarboxylase family protein n=1 Tax=Inquilinus sp. CAU 1745 TaxID=3140369 RepID=UPI00325A5095
MTGTDAPFPTEAESATWPRGADGTPYPPAPWQLRGVMYLSVWPVPVAEIAGRLPEGIAPAVRFGRVLTGTAWAAYGSGGILSYSEMLAAVRVRANGRRGVTVTDIRVDSPASRVGGRALWGIPKELAEFQEFRGDEYHARAEIEGRTYAALQFAPLFKLPGRWRFRLMTAQAGEDGPILTDMRARARIEVGRARWRFAADGPLRFLTGLQPLFSVRLSRLSMEFGI